MKKKLLKFSVLVILMITCSISNAQNLYWSGDQADVYYASFETNTVLWYSGTHAASGLSVGSSDEASLHGHRSAKFWTADGQASSAVNGSVTVILGGTNTYVDGNIGPITAGDYVFKARIHIVEAAPSQLMVWFNESGVGISGAGSSNVNIPLDGISVGGDATTEAGWQEITGIITLPSYTAMKTGLRTRPQDYNNVTGASTIYIESMELSSANSTDINSKKIKDFSLFPNPATDQVTISTEAGSSIDLYSATGSLVKSLIAQTSLEKLPISDLGAGMYMVKVTNKGIIQTQKLLVK